MMKINTFTKASLPSCRRQAFFRFMYGAAVLIMCINASYMISWQAETFSPSQSSTLEQSNTPKQRPWLAIASVCVDEGDNLAPDKQVNTAREYMNWTMGEFIWMIDTDLLI